MARHILAQRREGERYPCYITDLDLSGSATSAAAQTLHHLHCKTELESALNRALQVA